MSDYEPADGDFDADYIVVSDNGFPRGCSAQGTTTSAQLSVRSSAGGPSCSDRFPCICLAPAKSEAKVYSDGEGGIHIHIAHGLPSNQFDYFIEVSLK